MREFLNKHGAIVAGSLLVAAAAIWFFFLRAPGTPNVSQAYFVDEETGEEQVLPLTEYAPRINPKTGKPTLIEAIKYTCDGRKTVHVAYYRKYSDNLKRELERVFKERGGKPGGVDISMGAYVRSPEKGAKWIPTSSADSTPIQQITCPSGGEVELVLPP